MDESTRIHLALCLQGRQDSIAAAWYAAIAPTGYVPLAAAQVRQKLAELAGRAISVLLAEGADSAEAEQIGAALAGLHYTQPEVLGRTLRVLACELLHGLPAELVLAVQPHLALLLEGIATGFVRASIQIVLAEQGSIRRAMVEDLRVAERKLRASHDYLEDQVEARTEELRASEEQWRALVEGAPDLVGLLDAQGRFLYMNRTPRGTGAEVSDVLGQDWLQGLLPEHREAAQAAVEHVFTTGTGASLEAAVRRASGAVIWYSIRFSPLRRGGAVTAALGVARDITERKKHEETIEGHIRDVAHELRAPLAKAQMSLELMLERGERDHPDRLDLARFGTIALDNVRGLVHTVDAVLDLARLQAGGLAYHIEPLHPADLVRASVLEMEPLAAAKGLALLAEVGEDLPLVEGDRERLASVLRNLIDNSIKFSSRGSITVAVAGRRGELEIGVSDMGCGILAENLGRVFDGFFQERTGLPGAGVGLPMCKAIVEAHDGRIWAESGGRDMGTTVRFTLPASGPARG